MPTDNDPVLRSFYRARRHGLGQRFYEVLLGVSDEIAARFAHTDLERQVELFEHGVLMLLQYARGDAVGQMAIERLGRKHARTGLDVHPELYDAWLSCLVHVLGEVDPDFDDELRAAWIAAVRPGVRVFISMY